MTSKTAVPVRSQVPLNTVDELAANATASAVGRAMGRNSSFFEPVILSGLWARMRMGNEEQFWPASLITSYRNIGDALGGL